MAEKKAYDVVLWKEKMPNGSVLNMRHTCNGALTSDKVVSNLLKHTEDLWSISDIEVYKAVICRCDRELLLVTGVVECPCCWRMYGQAGGVITEPPTWVQPEEFAYPGGGMKRKGVAYWPDGKLRRVMVGIADTYFTAPAHGNFKGAYFTGHIAYQEERHLFFYPLNQERFHQLAGGAGV